MTTRQAGLAAEEAYIHSLIEDRARAVHDRNVAKAISAHAPDIVLFDAIPPLQYVGLEMARKRTQDWFSAYEGPIGYEIRDLDVRIGDSVAFCHYLYHVSGTMTGGQQVNMWVRATLCFLKADGTWKLVHEHDSVPFDGQSGRASLDLEP